MPARSAGLSCQPCMPSMSRMHGRKGTPSASSPASTRRGCVPSHEPSAHDTISPQQHLAWHLLQSGAFTGVCLTETTTSALLQSGKRHGTNGVVYCCRSRNKFTMNNFVHCYKVSVPHVQKVVTPMCAVRVSEGEVRIRILTKTLATDGLLGCRSTLNRCQSRGRRIRPVSQRSGSISSAARQPCSVWQMCTASSQPSLTASSVRNPFYALVSPMFSCWERGLGCYCLHPDCTAWRYASPFALQVHYFP